MCHWYFLRLPTSETRMYVYCLKDALSNQRRALRFKIIDAGKTRHFGVDAHTWSCVLEHPVCIRF